MIGVLSSAVAAFFYLRVTVLMYMATPGEGAAVRLHVPTGIAAALALTLGFTLIFGIIPEPIIDFARDAITVF